MKFPKDFFFVNYQLPSILNIERLVEIVSEIGGEVDVVLVPPSAIAFARSNPLYQSLGLIPVITREPLCFILVMH